jgi:predicted Zn-dependent protease
MKRSFLAVSALVLALALASASHAQFGGILSKAKEKVDDAQQKAKAFQPWSAQEEQDIGEATAAKMIAVFGLVDDPKIVRYVNLVGQAVAQYASRPLTWRFGVLDSDIVGAYALPGGYIFITRTALTGMTNEAQLAGALGHEITHCAERHLEREIRSKKTSALALEEANSTGKTGDLQSIKADAFVKDFFDTSLSRDKEDAADDQGTQMAAKAGYNAAGLMQFLTAMRDAAQKPENKKMFGQLLSTHPSFDSRIARLQPIVAKAGTGGQTLEARFQAAVLAK